MLCQRGSAVDGGATRNHGYGTSQRIRTRLEEVFGLMKLIGGMRRAIFTFDEQARDLTQPVWAALHAAVDE